MCNGQTFFPTGFKSEYHAIGPTLRELKSVKSIIVDGSAVSAAQYSLHLLLKFLSPGPFLLLVTVSLIAA